MQDCRKNAFCQELPDDLRDKTCDCCFKSSFSKGTSFSVDRNHPFVLISGVILSTIDGKPSVLLMPGNFALTPHFKPNLAISFVLDDCERRQKVSGIRYVCITDVSIGSFTNDAIDRLLKDYRFLHAIWENTQYQSYFSLLYQAALHHRSAYDAVRFALRCMREAGESRITHEQLARLTGRNRTTVTKVMHELALAEPELLEGLT